MLIGKTIDPINHPEMTDYEAELRNTVETGNRRQDALNPRKYRYAKGFGNLAEDNTQIIAIVLFGFTQDESGRPVANNYVATVYQKEVR